MNEIVEALKILKKNGNSGRYPRGCIHSKDFVVSFDATDDYHSVKLCSKCLEDQLDIWRPKMAYKNMDRLELIDSLDRMRIILKKQVKSELSPEEAYQKIEEEALK